MLITAIGTSRLPKHEEPRLIRAVADEVIEQVNRWHEPDMPQQSLDVRCRGQKLTSFARGEYFAF